MLFDNFDTAYEPKDNPFFVYDQSQEQPVAAGTFAECEEFIRAFPKAKLDIRRNN